MLRPRRRTVDRRSRPGADRPAVDQGAADRIFYASPAPGTAPYVQVGGEVAVGQVIGLIEAMKLFNEIKSDLAGRVVRVVPRERRAGQGKAATHRGGATVSTPARTRPRHRLGPLRPVAGPDQRTTSSGWSTRPTNGSCRARASASAASPPPTRRPRRWPPSPRMRAIRTAGIDPDEIDLILLATLTPDYWMPSTAALVKEAIGNTRAAAMDVAAACSGLRLRLRDGPGLHHERDGEARAGHRRGAADPLPRLHRPQHLHPVRRWRRARSSCRRRTSRAAGSASR